MNTPKPKPYIMRDAVNGLLWLMELHNPHMLPSHEHVTGVAAFGNYFSAHGDGFQRLEGDNGKRYIVNLRNRAVKLVGGR